MPFLTPKQIEIKYEDAVVQNMLDLLRAAPFPDNVALDTEPWKLGIDYSYLKSLKTKFETEWSWSSLEKRIARYENHLVHYDNGVDVLDLHYVYAKSARKDAIPLILQHGWPGMCITLIELKQCSDDELTKGRFSTTTRLSSL